jgi:hypothetical protein
MLVVGQYRDRSVRDTYILGELHLLIGPYVWMDLLLARMGGESTTTRVLELVDGQIRQT